jgi:hypothetical protein
MPAEERKKVFPELPPGANGWDLVQARCNPQPFFLLYQLATTITIQRNPNMKTTKSIRNWAVVAGLLLTSTARAFGQVETSDLSTAPGVTRTQEINRSVRTKVSVNGISLAVSYDGKLLTSSNGADWMEVRLTLRAFLRGLTYGDGLFVVVGGSYIDQPGVILTSRDGTNWTLRGSGTRANLYGVTHGNGIFVAVGENHTILASKNGVTWKPRTTVTSDVLLSSVAFGNGAFVAVGDSGTVLTSIDTIRWRARNSGTPAYLSKVRYEVGAFLATGRKKLSSSESTAARGFHNELSAIPVLPDL